MIDESLTLLDLYAQVINNLLKNQDQNPKVESSILWVIEKIKAINQQMNQKRRIIFVVGV